MSEILLRCECLLLADIVEKLHNCEAAGIAGPFDATRLRCCEAFGHCRDDQIGELAKVLSGGCK
jgi:hypothetical protein